MNGKQEPASLPKFLFFFSIAALMPVIRPALPGNTALFDFVTAAFIFVFGLWLLLRGRIRSVCAGPLALVFLASLVAMFNSQALSMNLLTLVQEVYLFALFLTLYNIIETPRDFRALTISWMLFAAIQGGLNLAMFVSNRSIRAQGTFDNPNMAASYLGISLFLICQPFVKLRWYVASPFLVLVLGGMFATKSLSALLAGGLSIAAVTCFYAVKGQGGRKGALVLTAVAAGVAVLALSPLLMNTANYLDRLPKSTDERTVIWSTGIETFLRSPLGTGIGPGAFGTTGFVSGGYWGAGRRISLHSDYLSFLVERGMLGFVGLVFFLVAIGLIVRRSIKAARSDRELLWASGLGAMFLFTLVDAWSHEVMHYRHVWLAFALIAAHSRIAGRLELGTAPAPGRTAMGAPGTPAAPRPMHPGFARRVSAAAAGRLGRAQSASKT